MDRRAILISGAGFLMAGRGAAADQPWQAGLVVGAREAKVAEAGLRIVLQRGWKTYWKMPGDSGIPPEFDWSRSQNVSSVEVFYPAPARFRDAAGETIGYHDEVIYPLRVQLQDEALPCRLDLSLVFAVCREVCIPAKASLSADMQDEAQTALLRPWWQKVPQLVAPGDGPVRSHAVESRDGKLVLLLRLATEPDDIFIYADSPAYFGAPQRTSTPGEWLLPISNISDKGKLQSTQLAVTIVGHGKAVEQMIVLN